MPAGVGGLLTVALVSTSGDESAPIHNATRLEPAARVRRHSLDVASPAAGPTTGGTVIAFTGEGFEAPMRCLFYRDSEPTVVPAVVESAVRARCVAPAGSGATSASLAFEDGCFSDFGFNYYAAPEVLSVRPSGGPRFGSVNVTVFVTNAWFLEQYARSGSMTPTCAFGMVSDAETAAAAATLVGYPGEDGASVVCVTPNTSVARGDHVVRVSFNAQQYAAPMDGVSLTAVRFDAAGPTLAMEKSVVHAKERDGEILVNVTLEGEFVLNVTVDVLVSDGGRSVLPGESEAEGYQPRTHANATERAGRKTSDRDFEVPVRRLSWSPAEDLLGRSRTRTIPVKITDDAIFETALEALTLTLVNATNADVDEARGSAAVTITDDDPALLLAARPHVAAYRPVGRDPLGHFANVTVDVVGGSSALPATVAYEITGGTLANGTQYVGTSGTLTWAPHDFESKTVAVELLWDRIPLETEATIGISLSPVDRNARVYVADRRALDAALHVYGVPRGACPPGTRRRTAEGWTGNPPPPPPRAAEPAPAEPAAAGRQRRRRALQPRGDGPAEIVHGPGDAPVRHPAEGGGADDARVRAGGEGVRGDARLRVRGDDDDLPRQKARRRRHLRRRRRNRHVRGPRRAATRGAPEPPEPAAEPATEPAAAAGRAGAAASAGLWRRRRREASVVCKK